jgi:predicted permease
MLKRYGEVERQSWLRERPAGKTRFLWRHRVLGNLLMWLILVPLLTLSENKTGSFSLNEMFVFGLVTLALFLLGGYLSGRWRWKDLEKKYPE